MPVATITVYEEMWTHPAVTAALSGGAFTYLPVVEWDPDVDYERDDTVLAGNCSYGGCIYRALTESTGVDPTLPESCWAWTLDQEATIERLKVYTATIQATYLLDVLTGFRLHGHECWQEDYAVHTCTIKLRRTPVAQVNRVISVHRCNQPGGEVPGWCHIASESISLCCGGGNVSNGSYLPGYVGDYRHNWSGCGCHQPTVRVFYEIESTLPPGTESLVAWLAGEYTKAAAGQACSLPQRISNITRQGVSWTVMDGQDFYDKGRTGIDRVDQWLAPVKLTLGGTIIDPLQSHRLFSERLDCDVSVNPL